MSFRKRMCYATWGSHGCDNTRPHTNHRCSCGMILARSGKDVKTGEFYVLDEGTSAGDLPRVSLPLSEMRGKP